MELRAVPLARRFRVRHYFLVESSIEGPLVSLDFRKL